jgi:hypothetical protein
MAAGAWTTSSGLGDANIAVGPRTIKAALNAASKNNAIIGHPVMQEMLLMDQGLGPLLGNLGVSMGLLTFGTGKASAVAEGTGTTATNFSLTNSTTITPARHAFGRKVSDFGVAVQRGLLTGELAPDQYAMLVNEGFQVWVNTLVDKVVALFASLSNEIGTTATDLTWGAVNRGIIDHKDRGNTGPAMGIIDAVGAKNLMDDTLSLGGAVQFSQQAQQAIQDAQAGAYLGNFFGVDFYLNSELDDDGTDRFGAIISAGCVQSKHAIVPLPREAIMVADGGWYTLEALRQGGSETQFDLVMHLAAQIVEDNRGSMLRYGAT